MLGVPCVHTGVVNQVANVKIVHTSKGDIMKKTANKDTGKLLHELRVLVGGMNLAVYEIKIRNAGYAVAYADMIENMWDRIGPLRINKYYPTLRKAVLGELKQMSQEMKRVAKELREEE